MEKVVVTGGAGFIGSHLVDRLLAGGSGPVVVIDNLHRGRRENLAVHEGDPRLSFVLGDVRDAHLLDEHLAGAEIVYHLAAQSNVMGAAQDVSYSFESNVVGTFNVLRAALAAGVANVVFASSREVYGEPLELPVAEEHPTGSKNSYGASKAAGEIYCRVFAENYGLRVSVLRLANVYGPRDYGRVTTIWLERAAAGEDLVVYGGKQVIDFVTVERVVDAMVRAPKAGLGTQPVNIGSGVGTPILDLATRITRLVPRGSRLDLQPARSVEVERFVADVRRMRALLGLNPPEDPLYALGDMVGSYVRA